MKYRYDFQPAECSVSNISVLNVSRGKNFQYSYRAGRTMHGFVYTVSGTISYTFLDGDTGSMTLRAGELIFIPMGTRYYGTYLEENTEIKIIQFELSVGTLPSYLTAPQKIELHNVSEVIESFFHPIRNCFTTHPFYYMSRLYELLWQINDQREKSSSRYRRLQKALNEISEHYCENQKISYYAQLCNMSESSFRRLFREYMGQSPIDYRNDIRLNNARIKLQSGEYNVSEAAETSGFTNLSFFTRLYKKKYGYTPKNE